jgi:hypothetical protein
MTNFDYYPRNLVTNIRGEERSADGALTRWRVDYDGILHVFHDPCSHGETASMTFRLVEVEEKWVEVDES